MKPETCGDSMPAPTPCTTRKIASQVAVGAAPHAALARVKTASPSPNTNRRLRASPNRPAGTSTMPKASV